jgi:hypothetical protein
LLYVRFTQVRGEACLLACAIANENHSLKTTFRPLSHTTTTTTAATTTTTSSSSHNSCGMHFSFDLSYETWRSNLGTNCGNVCSPFRRLVAGQAVIASHAESNLREIFWDPIRREEEEKDDNEDERHMLVSETICVCLSLCVHNLSIFLCMYVYVSKILLFVAIIIIITFILDGYV